MEKSLGWKVKKEECDYLIKTPPLSSEEESIAIKVVAHFSDEAKEREFPSDAQAAEAISRILGELLEGESLEADQDQSAYLASVVLSHLRGYSFLDQLLLDPQVEEIACIGIGKPVYVYIRAQGWKRTNGYFTTQEHLVNLSNKIARQLGRRLSAQTPRLNAVLPDGSRLHATIPPLSPCELTIRKFTQTPLSAGELVNLCTGTAEAFAFLSLAMQSDSSILIAGNTSSGKTTLLGALLSFVPVDERILLVEETPELRLFHPHVAHLLSSEEHGIGMQELIRDSLRMRPDRVIVGEVRMREECQAFMESVLSGQARGSYATFHAQSAQEAFRRLASAGVAQEDLPSIDFIVVQRRLARYDKKKRKMSEARRLVSISAIEKNSGRIVPLFEHSPKNDSLAMAKGAAAATLSLGERLHMGKKEIFDELAGRISFMKGVSSKPPGFKEEFSRFQKFAYGKGTK